MDLRKFPKSHHLIKTELDMLEYILNKLNELEQRIQKLEIKIDQYEGF